MSLVAQTFATDPDTAARPIDAAHDVGVALSGGGTRSASLSLGVMRALVHGRMIQPVRDAHGVVRHRYLSSVSGGTWFAAPWVFLPRAFNEALFLGRARLPHDVRLDQLRANDGGFAHAPAHAPLGTLSLGHLAAGAGDEAFSRAVGDAFLRPFGVSRDRERFFALDNDACAAVIARNPSLTRDDFDVIERPDRPFFIMGAAAASASTWVPFEITPLAVGAFPAMPTSTLGTGAVEPAGFDSTLIARRAHGVVDAQLDGYRFSLADAAGTSGAAPAAALHAAGNVAIGLPRFRYWQPGGQSLFSEERRFGDGGLFEHNGVIPLLRRGIRKLLVCVHADDRDPAQCGDLARLFGVALAGHNEAVLGPALGMQVFDNGDSQRDGMQALCSGLRRNEGWHFGRCRLVNNPAIGLVNVAGHAVDVLWTYTWKARAFIEELPQAVREQLVPHPSTEFYDFPHIPTFDLTLNFSYQPSLATVKLLAHLAYFQLTETGAFRHLCALFDVDEQQTRAQLARWRVVV